jgi:hypothetical protein
MGINRDVWQGDEESGRKRKEGKKRKEKKRVPFRKEMRSRGRERALEIREESRFNGPTK